MKKVKGLCKLWIENEKGKCFEVLSVQTVSDEYVYFCADGIYVSTRKGCIKLKPARGEGK